MDFLKIHSIYNAIFIFKIKRMSIQVSQVKSVMCGCGWGPLASLFGPEHTGSVGNEGPQLSLQEWRTTGAGHNPSLEQSTSSGW